MEAGLSEIARFLALRPPFDALAPEELGELVVDTQLEFYAGGEVILSEDGGPVTFLRVIRPGPSTSSTTAASWTSSGLGTRSATPRCCRDCRRIRSSRRRGHALLSDRGGGRASVARARTQPGAAHRRSRARAPARRHPVARADDQVRADDEHPRGRPADDRGGSERGDRRPARRRLRDRRRPRHPHANSRRRRAAQRPPWPG